MVKLWFHLTSCSAGLAFAISEWLCTLVFTNISSNSLHSFRWIKSTSKIVVVGWWCHIWVIVLHAVFKKRGSVWFCQLIHRTQTNRTSSFSSESWPDFDCFRSQKNCLTRSFLSCRDWPPLVTRGLFLESPETFRAYFGCHNCLNIFATPRF